MGMFLTTYFVIAAFVNACQKYFLIIKLSSYLRVKERKHLFTDVIC